MSQSSHLKINEISLILPVSEIDNQLFTTLECDVWLNTELYDKNDCLEENLDKTSDPFLNEVASVRIDGNLLKKSGSDNIYSFCIPTVSVQPKIDNNKNLLKEPKVKKPSSSDLNSKCDIIEKCSKPYMVISNENKKVKISVKNEAGKNILHDHTFSVANCDSIFPIKQNIVDVNLLTISDSLDVLMPSVQIQNGVNIVFCPVFECNLAYFRKSDARIHALEHLGHKPYKCKYSNCTWSFYTLFKLKRHEETHSKKKNFYCTYPNCLRKFTTIYNLNEHKKRHEKSADLPCPVSNCKELFQNARARQVHFKCHSSDEAPFKCPVVPCKKTFFLESALQTHTRSHTHKESELNCQWPNCGRKFSQPSKLKAHVRIHTGQKPYRCLFNGCDWAFTTSSKLRRHEISHTNERKFHCTIGTCNKSFLRSEHLKDHTLTHIGQRSFQCEECSEKFVTKPSLYVHIKKKHPEKSKVSAKISKPILCSQSSPKPSADILLEQAVQSLGVPSDMILGTGLIPDGQLELLENENFSTVNLRDLE